MLHQMTWSEIEFVSTFTFPNVQYSLQCGTVGTTAHCTVVISVVCCVLCSAVCVFVFSK